MKSVTRSAAAATVGRRLILSAFATLSTRNPTGALCSRMDREAHDSSKDSG
jgi:hypothetical protein